MSRWFRLYDEFLDDPKIQRLHPALLKVLLNIWCVASRNEGVLPSTSDLSFSLRLTEDETLRAVSKLAEAGFIDTDPATSKQHPHGWNARQYRSDTSTDRVRAHRERQKSAKNESSSNGNNSNVSETLHGTAPEQKQNRADNVAKATRSAPVSASDFCKVVFDSGIDLLRRDDPDMTERRARSIVGRWRKSLNDDAQLITILMEAETKSQSHEWVTAAVETRNGRKAIQTPTGMGRTEAGARAALARRREAADRPCGTPSGASNAGDGRVGIVPLPHAVRAIGYDAG